MATDGGDIKGSPRAPEVVSHNNSTETWLPLALSPHLCQSKQFSVEVRPAACQASNMLL